MLVLLTRILLTLRLGFESRASCEAKFLILSLPDSPLKPTAAVVELRDLKAGLVAVFAGELVIASKTKDAHDKPSVVTMLSNTGRWGISINGRHTFDHLKMTAVQTRLSVEVSKAAADGGV
jgi:hypothetical protein